eukprot:5789272-Alexandrium_andersonii.AAC.1
MRPIDTATSKRTPAKQPKPQRDPPMDPWHVALQPTRREPVAKTAWRPANPSTDGLPSPRHSAEA